MGNREQSDIPHCSKHMTFRPWVSSVGEGGHSFLKQKRIFRLRWEQWLGCADEGHDTKQCFHILQKTEFCLHIFPHALYSSLQISLSINHPKTRFRNEKGLLFRIAPFHLWLLSLPHNRNPPPQFPTFRSLIPQTHSMCSISIVSQTFKAVTLCLAQPGLQARLKKTGKSIFLIRNPCWCAWGAPVLLLFPFSQSLLFILFFESRFLLYQWMKYLFLCIFILMLPKYLDETHSLDCSVLLKHALMRSQRGYGAVDLHWKQSRVFEYKSSI